MASIRIDAADFHISSSYTCVTVNEYWYIGDSLSESREPAGTSTTDPTRGTHVVHFDLAELGGAKVTSAKMYATLGSPLNGEAVSTINGVSVGTSDTVSVDIPIADGAASVDVECVFACNAVWHSHGDGSGADHELSAYDYDIYNVSVETWRYSHQSSLSYTDVYLLIECESGTDGCIYRAENGTLVPYKFHRAEGGKLVPYLLTCTLEPTETTTSQFCTADGETFLTADGNVYKVLGG